jgi:hypothetical protein
LREWELSFRLGMRPWIAVAYSAPVAAATAVFLIYPIGQGSFSDGYTKTYPFVMVALLVYWYVKMINKNLFQKLRIFLAFDSEIWSNPKVEFYLKGEHPNFLMNLLYYFDYFDKKFSCKKMAKKMSQRNAKVIKTAETSFSMLIALTKTQSWEPTQILGFSETVEIRMILIKKRAIPY